MDEKRLDLFLNHLHYSRGDDHAIVALVLERYIDEIRVFRKQFDEALNDDTVGAHAMLPTTPAVRRQRGKIDDNLTSARPPPPETRGRKRLVAFYKTDSQRKRMSMLSETFEQSSLMSDVSLSSTGFDLSSIASQLPTVEDTTIPLTRQRSQRRRPKNPNELPSSNTSANTSTNTSTDSISQYPGETSILTRQRSLRVRRRQQLSEEIGNISESASKQQPPIQETKEDGEEEPPKIHDIETGVSDNTLRRFSEGMEIEDLEMKSPDLLAHFPPSTSSSPLPTPPERPAPPSSALLGSSVTSTPPARPTPPLIVSIQKDMAQVCPSPSVDISPLIVSIQKDMAQVCPSPAVDVSPLIVSIQKDMAQVCPSPAVDVSPLIVSIQKDMAQICPSPVADVSPLIVSIQKDMAQVCASPSADVSPLVISIQKDTAQESPSPSVDVSLLVAEQTVSDTNGLASTTQVEIQQDSLDQSHRTIAANISCEAESINQEEGSLTHSYSQNSVNTNTHLSPPSAYGTSPKPPSNQTVFSEVIESPPLPGNTITQLNTPSDTQTPPNPPSNPVTDSSLVSDTQSTSQSPAMISRQLNTPYLSVTQSSTRSPSNPSTDFCTATTQLLEDMFTPKSTDLNSHTMSIIPLPTPCKTFSIQKQHDAGLSITPPTPSELVNKSSSRPVVESPLLEQHPGPSMFRSPYDLKESERTPRNNPRPAHLPAGATHTILKNVHAPKRTRTNSPSKFHSKCSPLSNSPMLTNTPKMWSAKNSPSKICQLNLSKTPCSPLIFKSPNASISSKLNSNATRTNINTTQSSFFSPSNSITQMTNSSIQNIPRGFVSNLTGKFQINPQDKLPGKLALSVSTFLKKKPANPPVNALEESKAKIEHKQQEDERRFGGLIAMKQRLLNKKKQENTKRQQEAAERRAELFRKQKERANQKLDHKEEKIKQWERQSMRKKKAEEERSKREEGERRRVEDKRNLEKPKLKPSNSEISSTTFNTSSFMSSTQTHNDVTSYQIDDLDSENTDDEDNPRHSVPSWATEPYLLHRLHYQFTGSANPDIIFPPPYLLQPMELTLVFEYNRYRRCKRPYHYRTSSAHWTSPMGKPS